MCLCVFVSFCGCVWLCGCVIVYVDVFVFVCCDDMVIVWIIEDVFFFSRMFVRFFF